MSMKATARRSRSEAGRAVAKVVSGMAVHEVTAEPSKPIEPRARRECSRVAPRCHLSARGGKDVKAVSDRRRSGQLPRLTVCSACWGLCLTKSFLVQPVQHNLRSTTITMATHLANIMLRDEASFCPLPVSEQEKAPLMSSESNAGTLFLLAQ
jgi:hypothetical protein